MNKVELVGRIAKDVEFRQTASGKSVVPFTLAVNRDFKNENGEKEADFFTCVAWGNQADAIAKYCRKGDRFAVCGRLQNRNYEKDGRKIYITEVIVESFDFLADKQEQPQGKKQDYEEIVSDDELPF